MNVILNDQSYRQKNLAFRQFVAKKSLRTCSRSTAPLPFALGRYSKSSFTLCKLRFLRSIRTQLAAARNDLEQVLKYLMLMTSTTSTTATAGFGSSLIGRFAFFYITFLVRLILKISFIPTATL